MNAWPYEKCIEVLDELYEEALTRRHADQAREGTHRTSLAHVNETHIEVFYDWERSQRIKVKHPPTPVAPGTVAEQVVALTKRGLPARKVASRLGITKGTARRLAEKHVGPVKSGASSRDHFIPSSTLPYVIEAMMMLGKDPYVCEICEEPQDTHCIVHHTKYVGATLYDLMFVCSSCNNARVNKGLT